MLSFTALCALGAALSTGPSASARPVRASPFALKALRDIALVGDQMRELQDAVRPAAELGYAPLKSMSELTSFSSALEAGTSQLAASLASLTLDTPPPAAAAEGEDAAALDASKPQSLKELTEQASRLHQLVDEERQLLLILEEQESGSASRTRAAFDEIDVNRDGTLSYDEFEAGAKALLRVGATQDSRVTNELQSRFHKYDGDGDGSLTYDEFVALIQGLRGEAIGPLRQAFTAGLQELLGVSLQMIALTLSSELSVSPAVARPGRAKQLSAYVDRWCEIEEDAACVFADSAIDTPYSTTRRVPATAPETPASSDVVGAAGGAAADSATGVVVSSGDMRLGGVVVSSTTAVSGESGVVVSTGGAASTGSIDGASVAERCELLLTEVGQLAGALSLPNATTANEGLPRRMARQLSFAISSFKQAMGFCARGFSILLRDCAEVGLLVSQVRGSRPRARVRLSLSHLRRLSPLPFSRASPPFPLSPTPLAARTRWQHERKGLAADTPGPP